ncbi:MAG: chromosomal replication initiator protein DnaA [Candidatus Omnitrophica bacterium]|nr:chromosomal replication initiator protein DnaA [Candidatus Omnitrophota bacterium]MCM8809712.1 chromosomal replication initiator protein DnaA [Candidatus Omnitrophota bacterium]MCM8810523.1 chromosomal replication initiator protein DnaA [Candidatus Omnitrophota bacterium]
MEKEVYKLWDMVLKNIEEKINNSRTFDLWIKPVKLMDIDENIMKLEIPNSSFEKNFLPYIEILKEEVEKIFGFNPKFEIVYSIDMPSEVKEDFFEIPLNPEYTFENFIVGPCNRLAHAASVAVAQSPGVAYNPLFLYGGVGLGKTHLMQAIGHFVKEKSNAKIAYVPSEYFVNEFISSIKNKTTHIFRNKYRNLDYLLIDDIHFIAGKEGTQEEFFHTFNFLYDKRKQIILSSDKPPKEIKFLEKRLVSRFEWGLIVDLQVPDFETRVAIIKKKSELRKLNISDEIVFYIAEKIKENIRLIEGILNGIIANINLLNRELDKNLIDEIIEGVYSSEKKEKKYINIKQIMNAVCEYFGLVPEEIKSKKRIKNIILPRQIAMYLGRELTNASLNSIAFEFGGKDHTTVLHACKKVKELMEKDKSLKDIIEKIKENINEQ